jgi:hypothetical protein
MKEQGLVLILAFLAISCAKRMQFERIIVEDSGGVIVRPPDDNTEDIVEDPPFEGVEVTEEDFYPYARTKNVFFQEKYDNNETSIVFQVFDRYGHTVSNIKKTDLRLLENGRLVNNYDLDQASASTGKSADIVFVLDITGSMKPSIDSVKANVSGFVQELANRNVKTRLCFVTFKDWVYQKCLKFAEDDPNTVQNENLMSFLEELSKVSTSDGADPDENQLAGLMSAASETPWKPGAQRMAILITDAWFHFAHTNRGDAGIHAPLYDDAIDVMKDNNMTVHIVAPQKPGYNEDFFKKPSIVAETKGLFFDLARLEDGLTDLSAVLEEIAESLSTTYEIRYIVEDNPGLDPTRPMDKRNVKLSIKRPGVGILQTIAVLSNMPNGRPEYKDRWILEQSTRVVAETVEVKIDSQPMIDGFEIRGKTLVFDETPAPGARIDVSYERGSLKQATQVMPFFLRARKHPEQVVVEINGTLASKDEHFKISENLERKFSVELQDAVFAEDDQFGIRGLNGLHVKIWYLFK